MTNNLTFRHVPLSGPKWFVALIRQYTFYLARSCTENRLQRILGSCTDHSNWKEKSIPCLRHWSERTRWTIGTLFLRLCDRISSKKYVSTVPRAQASQRWQSNWRIVTRLNLCPKWQGNLSPRMTLLPRT